MQWPQALALLQRLFDEQKEPNMACYNVTISGCIKGRAWQQTAWLLSHLQRQGFELDQRNSVALVEASAWRREEAQSLYRSQGRKGAPGDGIELRF